MSKTLNSEIIEVYAEIDYLVTKTKHFIYSDIIATEKDIISGEIGVTDSGCGLIQLIDVLPLNVKFLDSIKIKNRVTKSIYLLEISYVGG